VPCASTHDTHPSTESDYLDRRQAELVAGLRARLAASGNVEVLETHISRVLLAGADAYKLKKPVNLGFLDFSTRAQRRHFAEEEVRLNRRLAPKLYLGVVPITGTPDAPELGGEGRVQDYAVHMRRFSQNALLTRHALTPEVTDALAARIAAFHAAAPAAPADSDYGTPAQVLAPMRENFAVIRDSLAPAGDLAAQLAKLEDWTREQYQRLATVLAVRRQGGHIRECHGDLHRANIAVVEGEPLIFDCIEFNPALRWIDTASEVAFLLMDLAYAGEAEQGRRLLNAYLMHTGDYGALALLRFYLVYRAMVRAKVTAIGAAQHHHTDATQDEALRSYVREAQALSRRPPPPRLVMLCGLSGSGKTWLATRLSERLPLVHIRSDVERKRLFGLPPLARTETGLGAGIYAPDATERTYARLLALAQQCLDAGYGVLVDATFLSARRRRPFRELADAVGCPFDILASDAPAALLRRRVLERHAAGTDASEADLNVLDRQLANREPLTDAERDRAIFVDSGGGEALEGLVRHLCV
jgi:hypothetical protein